MSARTVYKLNMDGMAKMLSYIARENVDTALMFCKRALYAKRGNEPQRELTTDEARKIISKGFK